MSKNDPVIIIHETVAKSWMRDASTFALFGGLIGVGILLDSSAMQWMGAIIAFITIIEKSTGLHAKNRMTIDQARKRLDELEAA